MGAKKLNEEDEDDGYWDEGEAPWRESASKYDEYDESNPFSLKNILWLSDNNKYPSHINDSEHRVMEKLISLLSNWDIEPEYSEVTQEMLQKACGDFPSKRDMKHTLNSLSQKGLLKVVNVPTGEYKRDNGGFMVIGKDKRPIAITEPLIYPKPLMCLYAWNTGWATPKWLQYALDDSKKQTIFHTETFNARYGGSNCGKCGGSHSGYCPDYGKEEYEYTKCTDCKWGSSTDSEYGPKNRVIEWCSSCKEKNEREAKINAERLRLQKEREEEEAQRRIDDEKSYWEWRDYQEDRYGAESFGADAASFDGGYRCSTCDKQYLYHNDAKHGGCEKDRRLWQDDVGEGCRCMEEAEDRAEWCCIARAESFAGEMDATQCDYCEKNNAKSEFPPVKGYWGRIHPDDPNENDKMGYCSHECFVGSLGKCDDCSSPFKIGDNYNRYEDEYDTTLICDDCFKGYPICEACDEVYDPEGEHKWSLTCSYCEGDGYILTSYTPATYHDPADADGHDCEACGGIGHVCSEGEGYNPYARKGAESNELEESKKRTKMSMIRTGLAITTFGIVLFNLWTNKKQEKDISDIMDLV